MIMGRWGDIRAAAAVRLPLELRLSIEYRMILYKIHIVKCGEGTSVSRACTPESEDDNAGQAAPQK